MEFLKFMIFLRQFFNAATADLIGINRYQNTIQNHNLGLKEILIKNSKTALESALLNQYYSFLSASKSIQTIAKSTTHSDEKFSKLKTVVKRTFRRNRYFKNMQSD